MHNKARQLFYALSMFLLMNALFVMQDNQISDNRYQITEFKQEIRDAFSIAFLQTAGDKPLFEDLEIGLVGIVKFYEEAADEMLALLAPTKYEDGMSEVIASAWQTITINNNDNYDDDRGAVAGLLWEGEYMTDEPLYNIHPDFNSPP
ncbi:MAG: hypothetical protein HYV13_04210 [Candidatus Doudnabacteria bacterium]|nr:hypothetical protein [Candidatus Doudnabacteria bacterium]